MSPGYDVPRPKTISRNSKVTEMGHILGFQVSVTTANLNMELVSVMEPPFCSFRAGSRCADVRTRSQSLGVGFGEVLRGHETGEGVILSQCQLSSPLSSVFLLAVRSIYLGHSICLNDLVIDRAIV